MYECPLLIPAVTSLRCMCVHITRAFFLLLMKSYIFVNIAASPVWRSADKTSVQFTPVHLTVHLTHGTSHLKHLMHPHDHNTSSSGQLSMTSVAAHENGTLSLIARLSLMWHLHSTLSLATRKYIFIIHGRFFIINSIDTFSQSGQMMRLLWVKSETAFSVSNNSRHTLLLFHVESETFTLNGTFCWRLS